MCALHIFHCSQAIFLRKIVKKIDCTGLKKNVFMHARNERVTVEHGKRSICATQAFWIVSSMIS